MPANSTTPSSNDDQNRVSADIVAAKMHLLLDLLDMRPGHFADQVGISPATMSRLQRPKPKTTVTRKTLTQIADAVNIPVDWLTTEGTELPLSLSIGRSEDKREWDGTRLRRFRERNNLKSAQVADLMEKGRSSYNRYERATRQIGKKIRKELVQAFSKLLNRTVTEVDIFGVDDVVLPLPGSDTGSFPIPRVSVSLRAELTPERMDELKAPFHPATGSREPDRAIQYVDSRLMKRVVGGKLAGKITDFYALEIGAYDRMEPKLVAGDWVLAQLLQESVYHLLDEGLVALLTKHGRFLVRRIERNTLATAEPSILLAPYQEGAGAYISVPKDDISLFFHLPHRLDGPL
ncbi:hypothetical protein FAES_3909 [Fibrella aestuarina BUZ 2]|uniref:HTH cro/C1-type domain-containing protein n=1 Tax=Fibrella aestuarina BUZ 2 TaxID=1166018 RepID=I0KCR2_9BACT|nr:helix-turn-helix transcriptional regulator [Fibrella aestuarina]CCH01915.1 hypothetical protein FAES_3909 [Fibrella aestuarina BUZ 2]